MNQGNGERGGREGVSIGVRQRELERERQRETDRQTDRQTDRGVLKSEGLTIHGACCHVCIGTYVLIPVT